MERWSNYADLLKGCEEMVERLGPRRDEALEARLFQQFAMNLSQGYFLLFQSTPEHPEFAPFENSVFRAQPNPDAVYYYAPIDSGGTYRVTGERGNAPVAGIAIGNRIIGMDPLPGKGLGNVDIDDLTLDADGCFDLIFSAARPDEYSGDWIALPTDADFLLLRQFSYDWGKERDVRIAIERLDAPAVRPPDTASEIDARLRHLFGGYVRNLTGICLEAVHRCAEGGHINSFNLTSFEELGNGQSWPQAYWETVYDIDADEALLIETALPQNRPYWNIQVIDALWNQSEYVYRQSSLNGLQAKIDEDGRFRAILSHQDPGIANWLDTGGDLYGMLIGRWYRCSDHPLPTVRKIKFADIAAEVPAFVARLSPEERGVDLRKRRIGSQLRRKW
ncbi:DUF1214 domain-containing protein [Sphingopyxis sp. CCNWLW253]|uniref:DUF1214 domain-containing protein n=1 Tax=unclassified Sphingopyxis TaxID=2614943 RepID=UPI003012A5FB